MADEGWQAWVGRTQTLEDGMDLWPVRGLTATLGLAHSPVVTKGDPVPFPWVWMYFLEPASKAELGPDGHPKRGGFLPPVPYPRRMWAGSRCTFHAPVRALQTAQKTSTILSVTEKAGQAGPMVFVTVAHEIISDGVRAMREEQDIVYIEIPDTFRPPEPKSVPPCAHIERVDVDPVMLFRFSALTFNGHRIHYDRSYTMDVEKYPGLAVHGPLQAVLLYDYGTRLYPQRTPAGFRFRGMRPLFDFDDVSLHAREDDAGELELFTANGEGAISMKATLTWAA